MAHKDNAEVEEEPEFLVRDFEADEGVAGPAAIKIARGDAGEGGEVVDHRLGNGNVVVDEGLAGVFACAAENAYSSETESAWSDRFTCAVGFDFDFFALESDELCIYRYRCSGSRCFCCC